jgi:ABC-type uncharacterized transport system substrate-binding protein
MSSFQNAAVIAVLLDPNAPGTPTELRGMEEARHAIGLQVAIVKAAREGEFNSAFATIMQAGAGALSVGGGPFFNSHRRQIVALVSRHRLPAIYVSRQYPEAGGLMSYGPSQTDAYRRAAGYVGRILKGEKASDLANVMFSCLRPPFGLGLSALMPPWS